MKRKLFFAVMTGVFVSFCYVESWKASSIKFNLPYGLCVLILLICWTPAWLSLFPGAFAYDAYSEWEQIKNGMVTAHHPVIHVLLLGG